MILPLVLGIIGMCFMLGAFLTNQLGILSEDALLYDVLNAIGGLLLVIYAVDGRVWPFAILNGVWSVYSGVDVVKDLLRREKRKSR